ncbi:PP2C family protein-serine/threonine phosphatase [Actinomadura viridis]|uniref:Serine phosphatase RsbU (Regulator of sigma subunit) n=1 Tax=Actinomadura viridis TaxID=58110 RepID=A0A931DVR7_9ACTN|nr:PP2C family protein-serine/threonine phosphatase [Actinomadura viridis]MBG6093623.1 serine phosphatase RsbU (regulator of sigma subunit) [Actinomadura viridis]
MPEHRQTGSLSRRWRSLLQLTVPLGLLVVIAVAAVQVPMSVDLEPLLVVAPALTASFAGPRATAAVGLVAVGVQGLLRVVRDDLTATESLIQVSALVLVTMFVVGYAAVRDRRQRELDQVRLVSEATQQVLLRPLPRRMGPLRIASAYLAAAKEARVGGDLYAAARTAEGTRLIIGDVRGKGLAALGDAAVLLGAFHEAARTRTTLPGLAGHLEASVDRNVTEVAEHDQNAQENFITAAILNLPDADPVVELVDCGHPPPLLLNGHGVVPLQAERPALPLGLGGLSQDGYEVSRFPFKSGDLLLLYTDGVIEARDSHGAFYPLAERVGAWHDLEPDDLVQRVREDLLAHAGGRLDDDAAMIAVRLD